MGKLAELVNCPRPAFQPSRWQQLTKADTLFRALQEAVMSQEADAWCVPLAEWQEYVDKVGEQAQAQWQAAMRLCWCAEQAAQDPDSYRNEMNGAIFAVTETPSYIAQDKDWAWICIRTFLGAVAQRAEVAVVATVAEDEARLGRLVLEVLPGGAGEVAHHPADLFVSQFDSDFKKAMKDAWEAATALAGAEGVDTLRSGRWRLEVGGRPMKETLTGRSGGGAAARGWYYALTGKIPDEQVIVLSEADSQGRLRKINGVEAKVKAIVESDRFDTIAASDDDEQTETIKQILRDLGVSESKIRVV